MTEFEVLVIPISLILGLGVTTVLTGVIDALRSRRQAPIHVEVPSADVTDALQTCDLGIVGLTAVARRATDGVCRYD